MIRDAIKAVSRFSFGVGVGAGLGLFSWALGVSMAARACTIATDDEVESLKENCDNLDQTIRDLQEE